MLSLNGFNLTLNHFPNGELNILNIEEAIKLRKPYTKNNFVLKYESDKDLMALMFAKKQVDLRTGFVSELSISYMPYSRMDRAETFTTPFMLKFVCDFINDLNFETVYVHEPHSDVTTQLLKNVVAISLVLPLVSVAMDDIGFNKEIDYIVYPDKTALKRYSSIEAPNKLYAEKNRDFATGRILDLEIKGEVKGKGFNVLLVDDLCSYGGTFLLNAKKLKELGANKIYLLVGHCEDSVFKGDIFKSGLIEKVFTTNSILTTHNDWSNQIYKDRLKVYGWETFE